METTGMLVPLLLMRSWKPQHPRPISLRNSRTYIYPLPRTRWTPEHLQLYLRTRDFSVVVVQAISDWDLETAIYQVSLLNYATWWAISCDVLEGRSVHCDTCCMHKWGQADAVGSDPWLCEWCQNTSFAPKIPPAEAQTSLDKPVVSSTLTRDFLELICHINGESENSIISKLPANADGTREDFVD